MILETIRSPGDVRSLDKEQVRILCEELRAFLIEQVSHSGGHLASNLGVVELTVAVHRVFDTSKDRLVFDVGHQSYVHKALTGRLSAFSALRQYGGLSGFPKPAESPHDAFIAGHASNSVSVALGMARARTLLGGDYHVLALIGDGALTGGLAYEGLNDAGASGEPLIVILNDNEMSISRNVGAVSKHLALLRMKPGYYTFKRIYRSVLGGSKPGRAIHRFNHRVKERVKRMLLASAASIFEDMGFTYLGPVDGHDVAQMENTLRWAKELNCPVIVHAMTQKGKGYAPAEEEPNRYHGTGAFDPREGIAAAKKDSFSDVFGETMLSLAGEDRRVCAVTAAMKDGTGLCAFADRFPERFFDVGIAEGHACAMAAGLASQGAKPVFAVYSTFLQRAYDQLIHDTSLGDLHVVFAVDRAGLVGADGETHQGVFDAAFLSGIPHFTVLCPSSYAELRRMLRSAVLERSGPVAVRYPRGEEGAYRADSGEGNIAELRGGEDLTICAYGTMINNALEAAELLAANGISARVLKLNRIAPLEADEVCAAVGKTRVLMVAEECLGAGCVGERVAAILTANGLAPERLLLQNLGRTVPAQGTTEELRQAAKLDAESLAAIAEKEIKREREKEA